MSEQIREQISAFFDGELPDAETELLLKRMARDLELREVFGRHVVIGEAMRSMSDSKLPRPSLTRDFASKVNRVIDGETIAVNPPVFGYSRALRWWRPVSGAMIAAGVAAVAVLALQQRANAPLMASGTAPSGAMPSGAVAPAPALVVAAANADRVAAPRSVPTSTSHEALSYTVPANLSDMPMVLPATRLTSYVFAHSQYSSPLGQSHVLSDLIAEQDEAQPQPGPRQKAVGAP